MRYWSENDYALNRLKHIPFNNVHSQFYCLIEEVQILSSYSWPIFDINGIFMNYIFISAMNHPFLDICQQISRDLGIK